VGDLERADDHLDLLVAQDPQAAVGAALFRQLLRGEEWRQQFFREGRVPAFLGEPAPLIQTYLRASIALRTGDQAEAGRLLAEAESRRPEVRGTCNGQAFADFRDLDDLCAGVLEVLTSTGKYYWIPVESIESIELRRPGRARDLLWRPAQMTVSGGPDGEVYLPCLYAGSHENADDRLRLGRVTDWTGSEGGPVRGLGLKTFLVGDESLTLLQINEVTFESPVAVGPSAEPAPASGS
jgi:type VI secretion system protein ImpE